jgi:hypothetical protein
MERDMRKLVICAMLAAALCLNGCATSAETFLLGGAVGAAAGVAALGCAVVCQ